MGPKKDEAVASANPFQYTGYIIRDNINVRATGSTSGRKIGTVMDGEEVQVLQNTNGWYQIETANNVKGWIRSDFVGPKSLSYGLKMTDFVESTIHTRGAEMFVDENNPYAIVYMVFPDIQYSSKGKAESFAREIGQKYQEDVYPGNVEIRILNKDQKTLFTKVNLPKRGATNLKAPLLKTGRTYDFIVKNKNEILIQVLIPAGLSDDTLLDMCDEICLSYGDDVRKVEIYFAKNSAEGKMVFSQDGFKPSNKNVCRFYYLEDSQGPDYKSNFCD